MQNCKNSQQSQSFWKYKKAENEWEIDGKIGQLKLIKDLIIWRLRCQKVKMGAPHRRVGQKI